MADQHEREAVAADRIFGLLPADQARGFRALWDEFEARQTPEAKFAAAVDRFQPMLLNCRTEGAAWRQHGITPRPRDRPEFVCRRGLGSIVGIRRRDDRTGRRRRPFAWLSGLVDDPASTSTPAWMPRDFEPRHAAGPRLTLASWEILPHNEPLWPKCSTRISASSPRTWSACRRRICRREKAPSCSRSCGNWSKTFAWPSPAACSSTSRAPSPAFLLGRGKVGEVIAQAKAAGADVIVIDETLSPAQQRNWEEESGLAVIDRQEVILEVFADRAHTREAMLQVELARQEYFLPRLKRAWTHLSRQRGRGALGGEGETQLEQDRRTVRDRIAHLRSDLLGGAPAARRAAPAPPARARAHLRHRRLHQRRQVLPPQPPHRRPGARRGQAFRHARPDHAPARAAQQPEAARHRHRRLHPPPAARSRRGVQGHARGGGRRRFPDPRARRHQSERRAVTTPPRSACWPNSAPTGRRSSPCSTRSTSPTPPRLSRRACSPPSALFVSAKTGAGLDTAARALRRSASPAKPRRHRAARAARPLRRHRPPARGRPHPRPGIARRRHAHPRPIPGRAGGGVRPLHPEQPAGSPPCRCALTGVSRFLPDSFRRNEIPPVTAGTFGAGRRSLSAGDSSPGFHHRDTESTESMQAIPCRPPWPHRHPYYCRFSSSRHATILRKHR